MYHHLNNIEYFTVSAKCPLVATYGGKSIWAYGDLKNRKTEVRKLRLSLSSLDKYRGKHELWVQIQAFIPKRLWNTDVHGLIYTDSRWEREFRAALKESFPVLRSITSVSYTEQGMQGSNFVSLSGTILGNKKVRDFADAIGASDILDDMIAEAEQDEGGFK